MSKTHLLIAKNGKEVKVPEGTYSMSSDGSIVTIHIDGYIGWWHDKTELRYQLENENPTKVILNITSMGGDPLQATAMVNYLKEYAKDKGVIVETLFTGFSASSATYLAFAGKVRKAYDNVRLLYHLPSMSTGGTAKDLQDRVEELKALEDLIVNEHVKMSSKTKEEVYALLSADKYISVETALEYGFITEIVPAQETIDQEALASTMSMYGYDNEFKNISSSNKNKMKELQEKVVALGKYQMSDLVDKTKEELEAMIAEGPKMTFTQRIMASVMPPKKDKEVVEMKKGLEVLAEQNKALQMKLQEALNFTPQKHPAPNQNGVVVVGMGAGEGKRAVFEMLGKRKPFVSEDGKVKFGSVNLVKQEGTALTRLEMIAEGVHPDGIGKATYMSGINTPPVGTAWDFTEITNQLGAESIQVMNAIFIEKQRYLDVFDAFTVVEGIKHMGLSIIGKMKSVSMPYHCDNDGKPDVYDWEISKMAVHACNAVISLDAHEFARTYFAKLQKTGFSAYNYPVALHLMELFVDAILADVANCAVRGIRADVQNGNALQMFDGIIKQTAVVNSNIATNGMAPVVTGAIPLVSTGTTFHDLCMKMVNAIDLEYRKEEMVLYCSPTLLDALDAEYQKLGIYTQTYQDMQQGPIKTIRINRTNTWLKPLNGFIGVADDLMIIGPKGNFVISFDAHSDLGRIAVEEKLFCQKYGVAWQCGLDIVRVSPKVLAYNDQIPVAFN